MRRAPGRSGGKDRCGPGCRITQGRRSKTLYRGFDSRTGVDTCQPNPLCCGAPSVIEFVEDSQRPGVVGLEDAMPVGRRWNGLRMNDVVSTTDSPSSAWRRAFADTLIRLRPDLNPDAADELSDSAYLCLADLDPGHAAKLHNRSGSDPTRPASPVRLRR